MSKTKLTRAQSDELWSLMTITEREAELRRRATPSERIMCQLLDLDPRTRGTYKFQAHCCGFYADFLFSKAKLIVELDGSVHHGTKAKIADAARTRELERAGYSVIRFWNGQLRDPSHVQAKILAALGLPVRVVPQREVTLDEIVVSTRRKPPRKLSTTRGI